MRVLALTNLYPNPAQPERASFNRQQFRALATTHAVKVIAPVAWTSRAAMARRGQRRPVDGIEVEHPAYLFTPKALRGWYGHFLRASVRRSFAAALEAFRPDVVLGCWAYPDGWATVHLAHEAGLPAAVKVHGSDVHGIEAGSRRWKRTREALLRADAVIAVSDELARRCAAIGADPARVHVVRNGVDRGLFSPGDRLEARRLLGIDPSEELLLAVGNLVPVKGFDVLVKAVAMAGRDRPALRAVVIGAGPLRERLAAEARRLDAPVRFVGPRAHVELPTWFRAADAVVMPSRAEGTPNVLLEASACGRPWIASAVGGIPEIADGNTLVPPERPDALAEAIVTTLAAPTAPQAMFVPPTWGASAAALAEVLDRLVAGADRMRRAA